jgi:hypothetical protein
VILADSVIDCLIDAVGVERFEAIKSGEASSTPEEREKGEVCFRAAEPTDGPTHDIVLPPSADEVPYLPEDPEAVSVADVTQESGAEPSDQTSGAITLEGTAPPDAVVDIYIHSETSVIVATEADASGKWSYTLIQALEEGDHLAYATTRADGELVRSSAKTFQVAGQTMEPDSSSATPATPTTSDGVNWAMWIAVAGTALLVSILIGAGYSLATIRRRLDR